MIPFHNHSYYSNLDGYSSPEEIARRCTEIGAHSCGLTDHGVVAGHLHFAKALAEEGIKPIFGCELYHGLKATGFKGNERDQAHLIAVAKTDEGLRNLWRLVNSTAESGHFRNVGRVFWEDLEQYSEGLVVTSACALGLVAQGVINDDYQALNRYLDIFGDNFFIEIHTYPYDQEFTDRDASGEHVNMRVINEGLIAIAQERGIPMIYANDAHYAFPDQFEYHDLYLALQTGQSIYTEVEDRTMYHPPGALSIMDVDAVRQSLEYLPDHIVDEAIVNSDKLAEQCNASLPSSKDNMPVFVPSECPWLSIRQKQLDAVELFVDLVTEGIIERYGEDASDEIWERTFYECETLINDGIYQYFLWGWDEMAFCQSEDIIVGPGRGSSAGCIVAYALGITDVDPIHYGLIFERFWNSGRTDGFPDIDSDFPQAARVKIHDYLERRLGKDRVCSIGTVGRMKPKATVDRLYKGCGMTFAEADELKKIIDGTHDLEIHGVDQIGWDPEIEPGKVIYVKDDVGDKINEWIGAVSNRTWARERFVSMCAATCSRVQQYGIHASGVVISREPLADHLPAYLRGGKNGIPATQFDMSDVDKLHFIKLDILGLRTLDTLAEWKDMVGERGIKVNWSGLDLKSHPEDMWDMLHDGYAAGIFQVESGYPKHLCEEMNARSVEDLALIVALNRPGPIRSHTPDSYIARRFGQEAVEYYDKSLEPYLALPGVLEPTFGKFVYQEQVINYFNALGYNLSESDAVRKIMGKKKPEALAALRDGENEWKGRGYLEMTGRLNVPENKAMLVWEDIEGFASYAFNKSHAVAYGILGFRTLFAKYYAPSEYYAACVRTVEGEKRKLMLPLYVNEARRQEIDILPPDIEYSTAKARVLDDGTTYFGFGDIKDVGGSGDYICQLRNELDIDSHDAFVKSFTRYNDEVLADRALVKKQTGLKVQGKTPKQQLTANKITNLYNVGAWDRLDPREITLTKRQDLEDELLGVILTDNTTEVMERNADRIAMTDSYDDLLSPWNTKAIEADVDLDDTGAYFEYEIFGIVTGVEEKHTRATGEAFAIITVESDSQEVRFACWSKKWKTHKFLFRIRTPGIFKLQHRHPNEYGESYSFVKGYVLK